MSKKDKERAKRVQGIPIGRKPDGSIVYFNIYKNKEENHEIKGENEDMENYIVINGKRAELTEEQLEKLGIKPEKNKYKEMFTRIKNDKYFYLAADGTVGYTTEDLSLPDGHLHSIGNYCKDESIMNQRALREALNRLLWRASVVAREIDNPWDRQSTHYYILYDMKVGHFSIGCDISRFAQGVCYFPTESDAKDAIENIVKPFMKEHPDFKW